jgi:hypothetical protein
LDGLRGPFCLRLASAFNHRPEDFNQAHYNPVQSKTQVIFYCIQRKQRKDERFLHSAARNIHILLFFLAIVGIRPVLPEEMLLLYIFRHVFPSALLQFTTENRKEKAERGRGPCRYDQEKMHPAAYPRKLKPGLRRSGIPWNRTKRRIVLFVFGIHSLSITYE